MDNPSELQTDFELFFVQTFAFLEPGNELRFRPHLDYLCDRFQHLRTGERIVLNLPPRSLKTTITIAYCAWFLGRNPSKKILLICNKRELADKTVKLLRKVLTSRWCKKVFPNLIIEGKATNQFTTTMQGAVVAASAKGSLAGYGADLLILDDPNKIGDAGRPERLADVNEKFDGEIYSRLNNDREGIIIVVQHRLDENDLSGHCIELNFDRVAFPLIAPSDQDYTMESGRVWHRKKGELLTNSFSAKRIEKLKKLKKPSFYYYYQQAVGRQIVQKIQAEHFPLIESRMADGPFVLSIDTAQTDGEASSFNVVQAWQKLPGSYHLFTQFRARCGFAETQAAAKSFIEKFQPAAILIETATNGQALLAVLERRYPNFNFVRVQPTDSKIDRLDRHRELIRRRGVSLQANAEFVGEYLVEIMEFPKCGTDMVDGTSQLLDYAKAHPIWSSPPPRVAAIAGVGSNGRPIVLSATTQSGPRGIAMARGRPFFGR